MNDTVATEDQKQPVVRHELEARKSDRDSGRRTSSGPADICAAPPGRTYDRRRPNRSAQKKVLAMRPSTYDSQALTRICRKVFLSGQPGIPLRLAFGPEYPRIQRDPVRQLAARAKHWREKAASLPHIGANMRGLYDSKGRESAKFHVREPYACAALRSCVASSSGDSKGLQSALRH
jgi:hypothetical protein